MQNPNPTPAATGPTSTPASSQPTQLKPNNLQPQPRPQLQSQSQPIRPPAQMQPQSSAQQINRPPSQNQGGPPAPSTASSTSGLLDRTGDKARSGPAGGSVSGGNMQGSTNGPGPGPGPGQMMNGAGGGNVRPGPAPGGLGHPNRPTNIIIPSAFPAIPNSNANGQGPHHPPNSALNTPAGSTANTPTGTSTVGGPNSNFTRTNNNNPSSNSNSNSNSTYQPSHPTRMIGQNDRSVVGQGRLFAEPLAKEIARTHIERAGGRPKVNNNNNNSTQNHGNNYGYDVKGMVMADRAVEGMLASMMRSANRIKEHRVAYTNPRIPPFWPSSSTSGSIDAGAKVEVKKESGGQDGMDVDTKEEGEAKQEVPMWKIEVLDDPRKDIYAAHASIEESEKAKKSARVKERIEYDQRKRDEAEGRILGMGMEVDEVKGEGEGMQVDGNSGGLAVGASSGPSTPGPGAGAGPSTPGLVAPDSMSTPSNKKKPTKRNPQAEQDLAARRADEAMRKESSRAISSIKGMGKKYSWMTGGGVGASPKTPLSKLGVGGLGSGGKNRRTSMLVDGKIKIDSGGSGASSPSTPGPAGMRGNKRPFDGTPLSMSKRTKKGSGLMNEMTLGTAPSKPNPYEFVKVDDKLGMNDVMSAFRREVVRGGPNRAMYEKKYFEIMVLMAEAAHEEWKKDNAGLGGSTIAGGSSLALD